MTDEARRIAAGLTKRIVMRWRASLAYWLVAKAAGIYPPLIREMVYMTEEALYDAASAEAKRRDRAILEETP